MATHNIPQREVVDSTGKYNVFTSFHRSLQKMRVDYYMDRLLSVTISENGKCSEVRPL